MNKTFDKKIIYLELKNIVGDKNVLKQNGAWNLIVKVGDMVKGRLLLLLNLQH